MKIELTHEDLATAPQAVLDWVFDLIVSEDNVRNVKAAQQEPTPIELPPKQGQDKPKTKPKPQPAKEPGPTVETVEKTEVINAAVALISEDNEDALAECLRAVGAKRVSDCPDEQLNKLYELINIARDVKGTA